jgi:hypothetical protein
MTLPLAPAESSVEANFSQFILVQKTRLFSADKGGKIRPNGSVFTMKPQDMPDSKRGIAVATIRRIGHDPR